VATKNKPAADSDLDATELALTRIAKILAMSEVRTLKREEQVAFLNSVGYSPGEIAEILNIPSNAVSVVLYQQKKKSRRRRIRS